MTHLRRFVLIPVLCFAFACDDDRAAPTEDELAGESSEDGEAGKFDGADGAFTFFRVENDFRKCVSPLCGGFWISRVNRSQTRCVDGSWADRCYVADADLAALGMPEAQRQTVIDQLRSGLGIVRGEIAAWTHPNFGELGTLVGTEVWIANSDGAADGVFTRVDDSGIVCITTPCPNPLQEAKLNSLQTAVIDEIDLSWSDADDAAIEAAYAEVYGQAGLVIAGYRYYFWDGGWRKGRIATQFYTRVVPEPASEPACVRAGCSSELCVAADQADISTPCVFEPDFACYADATCEPQAEGGCGFTPTPALQACLDAN